MLKNYLIPIFLLTFSLTACGQKGALYLPKDKTSELPTVTHSDNSSNANNPNDLTNVQHPTQTNPNIDLNSQNPNIKLQDSQHDY